MANCRPVSAFTALRRKQTAGQALTASENAEVRAYFSRYAKRKASLHLKEATKAQWLELARAQGLGLSAWIKERVDEALHGNKQALQEQRNENERQRAEIGALRGTSGQLSVENSKLQQRIAAMEASLMEAMEQALRLSEVRR